MPTRKISQIISNQQMLLAQGDISVRRAAQLMAAAHVGSIMVTNGGRLVGIFTERDALNRVLAPGLDPDTVRLADVMTADPQSVTPDHLLGHALHLMFEGGFRHMPVVDGEGAPVGMVSSRDALGRELSAFEEERERCDALSERL